MSAAVVVLGESLVDVVARADGTTSEHPGGSCANVAVTLGRLGRDVRLLTRLGDDERGAAVRGWLAASGVRLVAPPLPGARTASATATLDLDGSATYVFDLLWSLDETPPPLSAVVHTGSVAATLEPGAATVRRMVGAARGHALVSYDPNVRPALADGHDATRRAVEDTVALADVVKVSVEDLAWLHPGVDALEVARAWLGLGPVLVVVTDGGRGAIAVTADESVAVPAVRVAVVDTVGAGDTFMGTLLDGLVTAGAAGPGGREVLATMPADVLGVLLARCARAAAVTVSRPGADPPTRAELDG